MKTLPIRLSTAAWQEVQALGASHSEGASGLVRDWIDEKLAGRRPSAGEIMKDCCGLAESRDSRPADNRAARRAFLEAAERSRKRRHRRPA
jgi:hypothetical protein